MVIFGDIVGNAKKRGTFIERKAAAIARDKAAMIEAERSRIERERAMTPDRKAEGVMTHEKYKSIGSVEDRVIEECSELIKAICKAKRFGYSNFHPDHPERRNWQDIVNEISDVISTCDEMINDLRKEFSLNQRG